MLASPSSAIIDKSLGFNFGGSLPRSEFSLSSVGVDCLGGGVVQLDPGTTGENDDLYCGVGVITPCCCFVVGTVLEAEISALPGPLPWVQFPQTVVGERGSLFVDFVATLVATEAVVEVVDTAGVAPSFGAFVGELGFSTFEMLATVRYMH